MKIAMVTTVGDRCGIAAYTASLVASLRAIPDTEVEVVPIAVGEQPSAHYAAQAQRVNAPDVDVVHIQHEFSFWGFPLPNRASKYAELRQLIRQPTVVTAHTTLPLKAIFPGGRNPLRWLARRRFVANRAYRKAIEVDAFDATATIVHTEAAHADFIARGLKPERLFVVPMGIPAPRVCASAAAAFRDKYSLHGKRVLTLFGYVTPNKGYALVTEILSTLPPDVVFVIAGGARRPIEEEYVADVKRHIRKFGVEDRVVITGHLSDDEVAGALQATDIALVPHTQATNSYSVTYPLAHGRPTVASDLACFREMASREDCLELFKSGDKADFRRKLVALLDDAARRDALTRNAFRYTERFMWPNVAARTREIYCSAINTHRAGP